MFFPKFVYMTKNIPFFPILHVFAPLNDVRAYSAWDWKTTLITWIFGRAWYLPWHSSGPPGTVLLWPKSKRSYLRTLPKSLTLTPSMLCYAILCCILNSYLKSHSKERVIYLSSYFWKKNHKGKEKGKNSILNFEEKNHKLKQKGWELDSFENKRRRRKTTTTTQKVRKNVRNRSLLLNETQNHTIRHKLR